MSMYHLLAALMADGDIASPTFSVVGSCVSNTSSLNFGVLSTGSIQAGDLAVYIDYAAGASTVTPSGFTNVITTNPSSEGMVSVKKLTGSEGVVTGMNGGDNNKIGLVFRPSHTSYTTITASDIASEMTNSNPASQSCDPSAETVPLILIGIVAVGNNPAVFSTYSPAADATITSTASDLQCKFNIYNSSPQAHTIDMNDIATANWLASFYLTVS